MDSVAASESCSFTIRAMVVASWRNVFSACCVLKFDKNSSMSTVKINSTNETRSNMVTHSFPTTLFHILVIYDLEFITYAPNRYNHLRRIF